MGLRLENGVILDTLLKKEPKITPISYPEKIYAGHVKDVIEEQFREQFGVSPVSNSPLDLRIKAKALYFAKTSRRHWRKQKKNPDRVKAQHFFKCVTKINLKNRNPGPNPAPNPNPDVGSNPGLNSDPNSAPPRKKFADLGRTQQHERSKNLRESAGGDADLLVATATVAAKELDQNMHFVLKKMRKNPGLAEILKNFIENDIGMYI